MEDGKLTTTRITIMILGGFLIIGYDKLMRVMTRRSEPMLMNQSERGRYLLGLSVAEKTYKAKIKVGTRSK